MRAVVNPSFNAFNVLVIIGITKTVSGMRSEVQLEAGADGEAKSIHAPVAKGASTDKAPRLCFVVDDEPGICHFVKMALRDFGFVTESFATAGSALEEVARKNPSLIFLDVSLDGSDAIDVIRGLGKLGYAGHVQLISGRNEALLNDINHIGQQHSLRMLPALAKPFDVNAVRNVIRRLSVSGEATHKEPVGLQEALRQNWIEFWYQPKINLKNNEIVGAEALARLRHPTLGCLPPSAFLPGADEQSLFDLTERALHTALRDAWDLAVSGYNLQLSVNIPASALTPKSLPKIVRDHCKDRDVWPGQWPGFMLEVTEDQVIGDLTMAFEVATQLRIYGVKMSIDDFGTAYSSLARLKELPFAELKIDRGFVLNCSTDKENAALCRSVIEIGHKFGCLVCAEGIENAADLTALQQMGCDLGQGFLFARPMPKEQFLSVLQEQSRKKEAAARQSSPDRPLPLYPAAPSLVAASDVARHVDSFA